MQISEVNNWPHITETEAKKRIEEMNLIEGFLLDSSMENPEDAQVIIKRLVSLALNRPVKNLIITSWWCLTI